MFHLLLIDKISNVISFNIISICLSNEFVKSILPNLNFNKTDFILVHKTLKYFSSIGNGVGSTGVCFLIDSFLLVFIIEAKVLLLFLLRNKLFLNNIFGASTV